MSRTHAFSSRPWRHTGKFSRKKEDIEKEDMVNTDEDMVNTDEDIVNADKDMVNADKEEVTKDAAREETAKGESEDAIRDIVEKVVSGVVEKENNIIEDSGQHRCFKIFNQVVKRRRLKKLVSFRTMRMAREKSVNHILLDIIIVRMNILSINQKIKEIEEKIK